MINVRCVKYYCKDDITKIENYDKAMNDKTQTWDCHHRLELTLNGEFAHTPKELKRLGMYYNRPYFELIFLTPSEHKKLHTNTEEHKNIMRESQIGKKLSEETKNKISEFNKNNTKAKGKTHSLFGEKFKEHFGITSTDNLTLYRTEYSWYHNHNNKCRWED